MRRIVTVSYTGIDAPGGVPKFNRDLHSAFPDRECLHFCWEDYPWANEMNGLPEWEKARTINHWLIRKLRSDDVVVADGFWADGLEHLPLAVSHSHGIWGHVTKDDVDKGIRPENELLHIVQVEFRRRWIGMRKHITAVSEFIANQMELQWGFKVDRVINNGVDTSVWKPGVYGKDVGMHFPYIIHGVNDRGNLNKGWDHIELLKSQRGLVVNSLDEAFMMAGGERFTTKARCLAEADLVVHPSGYEGNSMFVAEALASGVPVVGYDVGYLWAAQNVLGTCVMDRRVRSPQTTLECVMAQLSTPDLLPIQRMVSRDLAVRDLSIDRFRSNWRSYVEEIERGA